MHKKQERKVLKWLIIVSVSILITLLLFMGIASANSKNKVLPNTYLLGKDLGGMTYNEAIKYYDEHQPSVSGSIIFQADDVKKSATPQELGITVDLINSVNSAVNYGKIMHSGIVSPVGLIGYLQIINKVKPAFTVDADAYDNKLHDLYKDQEYAENDASIAVEDNQVVVKAEKDGKAIETDKALKELSPYLSKGKIPVIKLSFKTLTPIVKAVELEPVKDFLASHISGPVEMYYYGRKVATADISTMISWLDSDKLKVNEILINQDSLKSWLNDNVIARVAVKARPRLVSELDENQVIDQGRAGITVDSSALSKQVVDIINNNPQNRKITVPTTEVQPETQKVSPGYTLGKYSGKYIEINLSQQMLYTIEGSNLLGSYRISTGKWSMPTPQGEFAITGKLGRAYSTEYNLYMPYFMGFIGSVYGIHELPEWSNGTKEGESHLGTPVSHGCVRLGVGPAETVYNWVDIGTPVYIHK